MNYANETCNVKIMQITKKGVCPFLAVSAIIAGILILGLGMLRLYSYNLECRIGEIDQKIYRLEIEETELTKNLSMLKAPQRVFNVAKNDLGMSSSSGAMYVNVVPETIYDKKNVFMASENNTTEGKPLNLFVKKAIAGD